MQMTVFGRLLHQLRIENNEESLSGQAATLGVSVYSLAQLIRRGMRDVPDDWLEKIRCSYNLSPDEFALRVDALEQSADGSNNIMGITPTSEVGCLLAKVCAENEISLQGISDFTKFPMLYLNSVCMDSQATDDFFFERVLAQVPMSEALRAEFESMRVSLNGISLVGRTPWQRALAWYATQSLTLFSDFTIQETDAILDAAVDEGVLYSSDVSPIEQFIDERAQQLVDVRVIYPQLNDIVAGHGPISDKDLETVQSTLSLFDGENYSIQFLNEISKSEISIPTYNPHLVNAEQLEWMSRFVQALPYLSDAHADSIFEQIWAVSSLSPRYRRGRSVVRKQGGESLPLSPVGAYFKTFQNTHGVKAKELAEHAGLSAASLSNVYSGLRDLRHKDICAIGDAFDLSPVQRELLRHLTWVSRRLIALDTAGGVESHHILALELQRRLTSLSEQQVAEILKIIDT